MKIIEKKKQNKTPNWYCRVDTTNEDQNPTRSPGDHTEMDFQPTDAFCRVRRGVGNTRATGGCFARTDPNTRVSDGCSIDSALSVPRTCNPCRPDSRSRARWSRHSQRVWNVSFHFFSPYRECSARTQLFIRTVHTSLCRSSEKDTLL